MLFGGELDDNSTILVQLEIFNVPSEGYNYWRLLALVFMGGRARIRCLTHFQESLQSIHKCIVILNPARKCGLTIFDNVVNKAFSIKSQSRRVANFFT